MDVRRLFERAAERVPELAQGIGGIQKPVIAARRDRCSFDIGRISLEARARIPIARLKPVLVRPTFQREEVPIDSLALTRKLETALRERTARGDSATAVYWNVADAPGAYQLAGRYRVTAERVVVRVFLLRDGQEAAPPFNVEGATDQPDALAGRILAEAESRLLAVPR